jgi:hypothetical protein
LNHPLTYVPRDPLVERERVRAGVTVLRLAIQIARQPVSIVRPSAAEAAAPVDTAMSDR